MGEKTAISWTNKTWNPWMGCIKVSQGCKNCYMYREQERYGHDPRDVRRSKTTFNEPLKWHDPALVFTCSWSDWFIAEADAWRDEAWDIIKRTPHLTYQILTKRPERIAEHLPADWGEGYPNVWLGISAEDQATLDQRMPLLAKIPAVVRFVSAEPLLDSLSVMFHGSIDWLIVGGESGAGARPMRAIWAHKARLECEIAMIPFFFKQMGGNTRIDGHWGGNTLDGKVYQEMPEPRLIRPASAVTLESGEQLSLF